MTKKRLLIIEDDVDVAEMLVIYFTSQDYEVINAISGQEGIATARAKFPNLILLDVMLPDMNGFDVATTLRTTALTKYIPITFLTQRDARADKVAGLALGADDYITKPFDVEELRLRVEGSLRRSAREQIHDPRTGLPTNALVEETHKTLHNLPGVGQLNIHLIGFQPFREKYGFMAADEALAFLGQVLNQAIVDNGAAEDFAGQTSEDQFVIYTTAADLPAFANKLRTTFDEGVKRFYNFTDSEQTDPIVPLMHFEIEAVK